SAAPAVSTLVYFLMVALAEELGYRFFAGSWLLSLVRRPRVGAILAVVVPALIYGTTHTGLPFLPPEEPFWGRALVFTLVGCVWGWAFLRFDALTVVLSHWTADLFIFNWPRLASGEPAQVAAAVATIAVPLVPAVAWMVRR
ncbi:MAG: CPBP family intramembrane metalloprotease, partial [Acidobacteriota bacterium]